jgi:hypothetical protein
VGTPRTEESSDKHGCQAKVERDVVGRIVCGRGKSFLNVNEVKYAKPK